MADTGQTEMSLCQGETGCSSLFVNKTIPGLCAQCLAITQDEAAGDHVHAQLIMVSLFLHILLTIISLKYPATDIPSVPGLWGIWEVVYRQPMQTLPVST